MYSRSEERRALSYQFSMALQSDCGVHSVIVPTLVSISIDQNH